MEGKRRPGEHLPFSQGSLGKAEEIKEGRSGLEDKFWELWYKLKSERDSLSLGSWFYDNKEQLPLIMIFRAVFERFVGVEGNGESMLNCFFEKKKYRKKRKNKKQKPGEVNNFSG